MIDNFGAWLNLGTVAPLDNKWVTFTQSITNKNPLIRLTFSYPTNKLIVDDAYIRLTYVASGNNVTGLAQKIYPKKEPFLLKLLSFNELNHPNIAILLQIQKNIRKIKPSEVANYEVWTLQAEEYLNAN